MGDLFVVYLIPLWITFRAGKEDGQWGCFIALFVPVAILTLISVFIS